MGLPVVELKREEIVDLMERGAQERLHMSAFQMVKAYRAGELRDLGQVADLLGLGSLLREDDPLFAGIR
jgi:hypothetical protein